MRRLPTERTLEALVRYAPAESRDRFALHVQDNRRELLTAGHYLPPALALRSCGFQLQLVRLRPELLDERVRARRIVEGHGDLRPEHICFSEPIAIFDCIEFSKEFRTLDVANELAFLAAECDFLRAEWVGPQLLQAYQERSGDRVPGLLWSFYKSYRACVRAKVAALRADQLAGALQAAAAREAQRHLQLADQYAAAWHAPLVDRCRRPGGHRQEHAGSRNRPIARRRAVTHRPGAQGAVWRGRASGGIRWWHLPPRGTRARLCRAVSPGGGAARRACLGGARRHVSGARCVKRRSSSGLRVASS
jgi:hypothetical protein